jgi:uncharacterized integral membrane protein
MDPAHEVGDLRTEAEAPTASSAPSEQPATEAAPSSPTTRRDRLRHRAHQIRLYGWTALLVAALIVLVALVADNTRRVKVGWVFGSSHASLVWIILVAAIVGWLAGLATSFVVRRRIRRAMEP